MNYTNKPLQKAYRLSLSFLAYILAGMVFIILLACAVTASACCFAVYLPVMIYRIFKNSLG